MQKPLSDSSSDERLYAVIMGDLVGSEAATSPARLHAEFNAAVDEINDAAAGILSPLTITLGDEFQGLCRTLADGLEILRTLRLRLLADDIQCRFALGVTRLQTPLRQDRAWNMMGLGLSATREKLSDKRHPNAYRFFLPDEPLLEQLLEAVAYSTTLVELDWTLRQREVVIASIRDDQPATELAPRLGLGVRTLYKIRGSARFDFYQDQWRTMSAAVAELDRRYGLAHA